MSNFQLQPEESFTKQTVLVYVSLAALDFGIQHMSSLYISSRHASSTFPFHFALFIHRELWVLPSSKCVAKRQTYSVDKKQESKALANGFITNPFVNLGRHKAALPLGFQILIRKKEKNKRWMFHAGINCYLVSFPTIQHWAAVTTPTACLTSVQSMLHTSGRLTFRQHFSHLLKPFSTPTALRTHSSCSVRAL